MPIPNIYELPQTEECARDGEGMCLGTTAFEGEEFKTKIWVWTAGTMR